MHRDLKPHNVFFEDGYVKVGDYSLSKVITASHRSGHTLTVGTVHYMAPEIGVGRYDRTVDIYALGVLLYEMLTGRPPFVGETMGEVLMKHMAGDVDVSELDEPFASVVRKAMAKDPGERYQTVDDLVAALFGNASVADGVSTFSPNSLTVFAKRAAADSEQTTPRSSTPPLAVPQQRSPNRMSASSSETGTTAYHLGRLWTRVGAAFCFAPARYADRTKRSEDPISSRQRVILAGIVMLTMAWISNAVTSPGGFRVEAFEDEDLWGQFFIMGVIVAAAKFATSLLPGGQSGIPSIFGRLATVVAATLAALFIEETLHPFQRGDDTVIATVCPLLFMDWQWLTARSRPGRIRLTPCLGAAFIAFVCCAFTDGQPIVAAAMIGGAALAAQTVSAFDRVSSRRLSGAVSWVTSARETLGAWYGVQFPDIAAELRALDQPPSARINSQQFGATPVEICSGYDETIARPLTSGSWRASEAASHQTDSQEAVTLGPTDEPTSRIAALALCLLPFVTFGFVPICGLHRFVSGRIGSGILWLLTLGLAGVGQLVDLILIALGEFRDSHGRPLRSRGSSEAVNGLSSVPATSLVNNGLAVLGGLALTLTVMVGFVLAVDVPEMIAADIFRDLDLKGSDIESIFGTRTWPELLRELLQLLAGILAVIAVGLLLASRRGGGLRHALQVPAAMVPFGATFGLLMQAFYRVRWSNVAHGIKQEKIGLILEEFLRSSDFIPSCIGAAVMFTVALLILALPPRRTTTSPAAAPQPPVRQEA